MSVITDPLTGEQFPFLSRLACGLRAPNAVVRMSSAREGQFLHHGASGGSENPLVTWRGYQRWHMGNNGWNDLGYNAGFTNAGQILEGRGLWVAGGHTSGYNFTAHALCYVGDSSAQEPTALAKRAALAWMRFVDGLTGVDRKRGHRDVAGTNCPGNNLYDWMLANYPIGNVPSTPQPQLPPSDFDWEALKGLPSPHYRYYRHGDVLRRGTRGKAVGEIQWFHNLLWLGVPQNYIGIDGDYGPQTASAINGDQRMWNLIAQPNRRIGTDGVFGQQTSLAYVFLLQDRVNKGVLPAKYWS